MRVGAYFQTAKVSLEGLFTLSASTRLRYEQDLAGLMAIRRSVEQLWQNFQRQVEDPGSVTPQEFATQFKTCSLKTFDRTSQSLAFLSQVRSEDWFFFRFSRWALEIMTGKKTPYGHYLERAQDVLNRHLDLIELSNKALVTALQQFEREFSEKSFSSQSLETKNPKEEQISLLNRLKALTDVTSQYATNSTQLILTWKKTDGLVHRLFHWIVSRLGVRTASGDLTLRATLLGENANKLELATSAWSRAMESQCQLLPELSREDRFALLQKIYYARWEALDLVEAAESGIEALRGSSNAPGGVAQGGNTCYIASALQLLAQAAFYGYKDFFGDEPLRTFSFENYDGTRVDVVQERDLDLHEAIRNGVRTTVTQVCDGIRFQDSYLLAEELHRQNVTGVPAGYQGCALEVFENIWNSIHAPPLFLDSQRVQTSRPTSLKQAGDPSTNPASLRTKSKEARSILSCPVFQRDSSNHILRAESLDVALKMELNSKLEKFKYTENGMIFEASGEDRRTLDTNTLPHLLPIGLKRLVVDENGCQVKYTQNIDIPDFWWISADFLPPDAAPVAYRLIGFIRHWDASESESKESGNFTAPNFGHYSAYIKRGPRWYHTDDSSVEAVQDQERKEQQRQGVVYLFERIV